MSAWRFRADTADRQIRRIDNSASVSVIRGGGRASRTTHPRTARVPAPASPPTRPTNANPSNNTSAVRMNTQACIPPIPQQSPAHIPIQPPAIIAPSAVTGLAECGIPNESDMLAAATAFVVLTGWCCVTSMLEVLGVPAELVTCIALTG
ncbi:hypothetical protein NRB20_28280 [Nocardia sp. RB20]|uniref:Uncharacterized protein n=1 Tax=Nocardia macrotermitis TaxID=2585198 RepID=A0A7K0D4F0_9NOCA|nr:hypothetical protein [Nocardia macrotermitis]